MDRALQRISPTQEKSPAMNLRCVFHVSPVTIRNAHAPQQPMRPRMPSLLDLDIEWVDEPAPRGASYETWQRARGWASED